jgi:hypothetical protein
MSSNTLHSFQCHANNIPPPSVPTDSLVDTQGKEAKSLGIRISTLSNDFHMPSCTGHICILISKPLVKLWKLKASFFLISIVSCSHLCLLPCRASHIKNLMCSTQSWMDSSLLLAMKVACS